MSEAKHVPGSGDPHDNPDQASQTLIDPGPTPMPARGGPHAPALPPRKGDPPGATVGTVDPPVTGGPPTRDGGTVRRS
jgi:hypothetical protein